MKRWLLLIIFSGVLCSCSIVDLTPAVVAPPTVTPSPSTTPIPRDTGWQSIAPGVEYRELKIDLGDRSDRLHMVRIDPAQTQLRVLYDPDQPRRVSDWLSESGALVAVNGNYFDPQNHALGLVIQDGQRRDGVVYEGFGGMFAVNDADVRVRWNVAEPYTGEPLTQALQNFPMLVLPGGTPNLDIDDNGRRSPRTAVGQDRSGRIIFVVSPALTFTLTEFDQWLAASDLDLNAALNLDGGTSSGLVLRSDNRNLGVDSWVEVPDAIVVESR
ncbi:MAG TPA: phosphodiester glycosidase family protein [Anaerolineae bacterium]|nr:phosphodiester glycosidase family protein [Anaerolineae bacterium]